MTSMLMVMLLLKLHHAYNNGVTFVILAMSVSLKK